MFISTVKMMEKDETFQSIFLILPHLFVSNGPYGCHSCGAEQEEGIAEFWDLWDIFI